MELCDRCNYEKKLFVTPLGRVCADCRRYLRDAGQLPNEPTAATRGTKAKVKRKYVKVRRRGALMRDRLAKHEADKARAEAVLRKLERRDETRKEKRQRRRLVRLLTALKAKTGSAELVCSECKRAVPALKQWDLRALSCRSCSKKAWWSRAGTAAGGAGPAALKRGLDCRNSERFRLPTERSRSEDP